MKTWDYFRNDLIEVKAKGKPLDISENLFLGLQSLCDYLFIWYEYRTLMIDMSLCFMCICFPDFLKPFLGSKSFIKIF